jgi:hypothetical protein
MTSDHLLCMVVRRVGTLRRGGMERALATHGRFLLLPITRLDYTTGCVFAPPSHIVETTSRLHSNQPLCNVHRSSTNNHLFLIQEVTNSLHHFRLDHREEASNKRQRDGPEQARATNATSLHRSLLSHSHASTIPHDAFAHHHHTHIITPNIGISSIVYLGRGGRECSLAFFQFSHPRETVSAIFPTR